MAWVQSIHLAWYFRKAKFHLMRIQSKTWQALKLLNSSACHWNILKQFFNTACQVWNDNLKQMISFIILWDWHLSTTSILSLYLPIFHALYLSNPWYSISVSVSFWCTTNKGLEMFVTQSSLINILEWVFKRS